VTQWGKVRYAHRLVFPSMEITDPFNAKGFSEKIYYSGNFLFDSSFIEARAEKTILAQFEASGQVVDDETLQKLKTNTIQSYVFGGYLIKEEDGTFSTAFELKDGILYINGTPSDLLRALQIPS